MKSSMRAGRMRDSYFELIEKFPLCPIVNDAHLDRAIGVIDSLLDRFDSLDPSEKAYLDVLGDLVEKYENENVRIASDISDCEMLAYLIEAKGVSQAEVSKATGIAESTISAILSGSRRMTREHIGKAADYFGVGVGSFSFRSE